MESLLRTQRWFLFLLCILLGSAGNACGQDIFRQVDELRCQVEALKRDLASMKIMLDSMRAHALQQMGPSSSRSLLPATHNSEKPLDRDSVKTLVCEPLRRFVAETNDVLNTNDPQTARARIEQAQLMLKNALKQYSHDKDIQRILGISDAMTWDTASAVEFADSPENSEFLESLAQYKLRFKRFCGEQCF